MIPVDTQTVFDYVVEDEREEEPDTQSSFQIRALTLAEEAYLSRKFGKIRQEQDGTIEAGGQTVLRIREILNMALFGWKNFPPGSPQNEGFRIKNPGSRTKIGSRVVDDSSLDKIPARYRAEIADAIAEGAGSWLEHEKNSELPSES